MERSLELDGGATATIMIWDTAGQEVYHALTSRYFRGAAAPPPRHPVRHSHRSSAPRAPGAGVAVLVFSTVDRESFDSLPRWKEKVGEECGEVPMVIVQNKVDLVDQAAVKPCVAEAPRHGARVRACVSGHEAPRRTTRQSLALSCVCGRVAHPLHGRLCVPVRAPPCPCMCARVGGFAGAAGRRRQWPGRWAASSTGSASRTTSTWTRVRRRVGSRRGRGAALTSPHHLPHGSVRGCSQTGP